MFSKELESLIQATLADGKLNDLEKATLVKRAQKEGVDLDELQIYIESIMQMRMQEQKIQLEKDTRDHEKLREGNVCPHCRSEIPPLTKICPNCSRAINSNETSGDKELFDLVDSITKAMVEVKSVTTLQEFNAAKANCESLLKKANIFYGENKKIQMLIFDLTEEIKETERKIKYTAIKSMLGSSSKAAGNKLVSVLGSTGTAILSFFSHILVTIFKNKWSWIILFLVLAITFLTNLPDKEDKYNIFMEKVAEYIDNGQLTKAEALCSSSDGLNRDKAYILLATAYLEANKTQKAISIFREQQWAFGSWGHIPYKHEDEIENLLLIIRDKCIEEGNYKDAVAVAKHYDLRSTYENNLAPLYKLIDLMNENGATTEEKIELLEPIYTYGYWDSLLPLIKYAGLKVSSDGRDLVKK